MLKLTLHRTVALTAFLVLLTSSGAFAKDESMLLDQPVSEYKARRAALMKRVRDAESISTVARDKPEGERTRKAANVVIVLVGENADSEDGRFRQSNMFAYLTGIDLPRAALILWPGENREVLYLPKRNTSEERWTGPKLGHGDDAAKLTGCENVEPIASFMGDLFTAIGDPGKRTFGDGGALVYLLSPEPRPATPGASAALTRLLREAAPTTRFRDLAPMLGELRTVKSPSEISLIRKAIALTADAQTQARRLIADDVPEYRIEGAILSAFIGGGGSRAGFPSIVGSGLNSTILHYNTNRRTMRDGELVVVDIGAEYGYYSADITRTYPVSGKFTERQRAIYQLVLDCQTKVADSFELGKTSLMSQSKIAHDFFRESPLKAKDENGVEMSIDHFFTHGLGHYLGMDVHDVGAGGKPLPVGAVFTIEPGIYIPSEGFGVRIEDDYLVTITGLKKLSAKIPSGVEQVEKKAAPVP